MRRIVISILVTIAASCSNSGDQAGSGQMITKGGPLSDSITEVKILYYPSFTNSATLSLNRIENIGVFSVDTMLTFSYRRIDTIRFSIRDMELKTALEKFWASSFIYSLRQDSSMLGLTDGMPVWVYFINRGSADSVYLGNVYPERVNKVLEDHLDYLLRQSHSNATKKYLESLRRYL